MFCTGSNHRCAPFKDTAKVGRKEGFQRRCYIREREYLFLAQQTMTRDFTCSVSEFTSATGSIHVNSPDSVNTFGVSTCEITSVPVKPYQYHVFT